MPDQATWESLMKSIVVVLPAYNEAQTIAQVIEDFHRELPEARVVVVDNNSTDGTGTIASRFLLEAGVPGEVIYVPQQGKGTAVRRAFYTIDADIYVLVDADNTYPAENVHDLIQSVCAGECDMAVGDRLSLGRYKQENKRQFHEIGNRLIRNLINRLFRSRLSDILSGYRVFSRDFVKTFPLQSTGFELETELTLHCLVHGFLIGEFRCDYRDRPIGSESKLDTFRDGIRVLMTLLAIFKDYKPLRFFSFCATIFFILGSAAGIPVILEYAATQYVSKVPSAVLATGMMIFSLLLFSVGLILDTQLKYANFQYQLELNKYFARKNRSPVSN